MLLKKRKSVTYPTETATQPSAPKPTESEPAVNHGSSTASGSGSTNHSTAAVPTTAVFLLESELHHALNYQVIFFLMEKFIRV